VVVTAVSRRGHSGKHGAGDGGSVHDVQGSRCGRDGEQLAHLLVHGTIDEDDLVDAVVVVHVVRRELRGPPRLARVASRL
jgi:hypothetical protein